MKYGYFILWPGTPQRDRRIQQFKKVTMLMDRQARTLKHEALPQLTQRRPNSNHRECAWVACSSSFNVQLVLRPLGRFSEFLGSPPLPGAILSLHSQREVMHLERLLSGAQPEPFPSAPLCFLKMECDLCQHTRISDGCSVTPNFLNPEGRTQPAGHHSRSLYGKSR